MKKNFIYGMAAIASMLFATSCSQEVLQEETANLEYINASFDVNGPEGINSRATAIGVGEKVNKLVCATFDANGTELDLREIKDFGVNQTATYNVRLVKGQNYRVAFFAYYDGEDENNLPDYYDITDLHKIEIKDSQLSNIEERDAFTANLEIETGWTMQPIKKSITLYRPFAQLNLGTEKDDWAAAVKAGVTVGKTKVTVSNVYKAFSAYDDAVVGETSAMSFDLNTLPEPWLKADVDNDGTDEEYKYLALNYLLVGDKKSEQNLTNITFEWQDANNEKKNSPVTEYKNIPVQRNHRTNILGWLLTNPAEFNITIDARFDADDYNITNIDGTVNVKDAAEVLISDGFMDMPNNVATIANKHITAEGTAIVLNELPANAEGGVLYIKNSTINAETFLAINGQFTIIVRNCHLNVTTLMVNNTNRRDLQIHFEDCYVNGTPLTSSNKTEFIDVKDFGTVTARFNKTSDDNTGNEGEGGDNTGDDNTGDNTGGGDNTGNEGEGGDDNTGDEGESNEVKISESKNSIGEIYNDQFFYIHDKVFNGKITIDEDVKGNLIYFENVTFNDYIYLTDPMVANVRFDNCTFSQKDLFVNQTNSTTITVMVYSNCKLANGDAITTEDVVK